MCLSARQGVRSEGWVSIDRSMADGRSAPEWDIPRGQVDLQFRDVLLPFHSTLLSRMGHSARPS